MPLRPTLAAVTLTLMVWGSLYALQQQYGFAQRRSQVYEDEMQNPTHDPPDAYEDAEFVFARLTAVQTGPA